MSDHKFNREYVGKDIDTMITPTCSCGWRGIGYGVYNDYCYTLVQEQEQEHIEKATQTLINERIK